MFCQRLQRLQGAEEDAGKELTPQSGKKGRPIGKVHPGKEDLQGASAKVPNMTPMSHPSCIPKNPTHVCSYCFKVSKDIFAKCKMKAKVSCSSPKLQPPFLTPGLSWEGLQPWLGAAAGRGVCAHTAGEGRAAMLLAWWLAPHGTHQGSADWQGGWSRLQTYMHGSARHPSKVGSSLWGDALKILCPGGKRRTVAVPEAWLPQPQAPSSPPFPRLGTVGDRFYCFSRLLLPAPSLFEPMSHFLSSDPTFQNFLFPLQGCV